MSRISKRDCSRAQRQENIKRAQGEKEGSSLPSSRRTQRGGGGGVQGRGRRGRRGHARWRLGGQEEERGASESTSGFVHLALLPTLLTDLSEAETICPRWGVVAHPARRSAEKEIPRQLSVENALGRILLFESHKTPVHIKSSKKSYSNPTCFSLFTFFT